MTFISAAQLEARAAELWRRFRLTAGFDIERLIDYLDLRLMWDVLDDTEEDHVFGALDPARSRVILNERHASLLEFNEGLRRFTLAHEIGHWILHVRPSQQGELSFGEGRRLWCRQRSTDAREIQAERFGAYLLMPSDVLGARVASASWKGWSPIRGLASQFKTSTTATMVRLEMAGLAHRDREGIPRSGAAPDKSDQLNLWHDDVVRT